MVVRARGLGHVESALLGSVSSAVVHLKRSRTVATGIVVVCGLAVVIRLETEGDGRSRSPACLR